MELLPGLVITVLVILGFWLVALWLYDVVADILRKKRR